MIAEVMLDTNILVYAASRDVEHAEKQRVAMSLIQTESLGTSGQVLQEFFVACTKKGRTPLTSDEALDWIEQLEEFPCIPIDASLVRNGAELARTFRISYWDGAVLAAAHRLQARTLYSEDLNDGQAYGSVRVVNPFRSN
jgi:predicted nucleic acid-binding protein